MSASKEVGARFRREAFVGVRMLHPNCVAVSDFGTAEDGSLYLVMELLDGESLGHLLERDGRVPWRRAVHIARHVLRGLEYAHRESVVHRDIKPDNIFLITRDGDPGESRLMRRQLLRATLLQPGRRLCTLIDMMRFICLASVATALAACSDDPVSYSEPVGIHLAVSDSDVTDTTAYDEKNINTESGNPYGEFAAAAMDAVGGIPSRIVVEATTIEIASGSDVADVDAVFDGPVDISFVMNGSDAVYPVASRIVAPGDGPGPLAVDVLFDSDDVVDTDYPDLAGGSFKVVLEGEVTGGFVALGGTADFEVVFTFTAYE